MRHLRDATRLVLASGLWLGMALDPDFAVVTAGEPAAAQPLEWPKAPGAAFALPNNSLAATKVLFDAKGRDLLDFACLTEGRALFGRSFDLVCDGGFFFAKGAGTWIGLQVAKSGAFTVEVTIAPLEAAPKARGVVLAYADEKGEDFALLQDKTGLALRLAGTQPIELFAPEAGKPVHVLITCEKEKWAVYRDGQMARSGALTAAVPAWGTRQLFMGAACGGVDPWRGRMEGIAIFPCALSAEEAAGEAATFKALLAQRKPAQTVRFRGTLVRQARTAGLDQLKEYSRSMTAAEYKVDQVLSGEWKEPTIVVLHWMIIDRKYLPLVDRKPGTKVEMSVERCSEHPQLESCRRDDELDGILEAEQFYCESENDVRP